MLECVVNLSEGRDEARLERLSAAAGTSLRDLHRDPDHHRSVLTLIDEADELGRSVRRLARATWAELDLREHRGVHPRFGALDVVPFVALDPEPASRACDLRDETAAWIAEEGVGVFLYGPERTLPEARARARAQEPPDLGPRVGDLARGVVMVGCRPLLLAWNLWLEDSDLAEARRLAALVRSESVRALGLAVSGAVQVSCNLVDLERTRPSQVYDAVAASIRRGRIARAELVGLAPRSVLAREDPRRLSQLDLSEERTIEARLDR